MSEVKMSKDVKKEKGASMVEYALLVALIAVVCITAVSTIGTQTNRSFDKVADAMVNAVGTGT